MAEEVRELRENTPPGPGNEETRSCETDYHSAPSSVPQKVQKEQTADPRRVQDTAFRSSKRYLA